MQCVRKLRLSEVNQHLVCVLCGGYFIDATTIVECLHSFCRSCLIKYLETNSFCPICDVQIHKAKPYLNIKPDKALQDIVYKLVPGLFHSEMRRRREFYAKHPEYMHETTPEGRGVGVERLIYSPDDFISLSLEYLEGEENISSQESHEGGSGIAKRYLQCPALVTIGHLKKFLRNKYELTPQHLVEIIHRREALPDDYTLMDVAYIYTWKRNGPMRFFFLITQPPSGASCLPKETFQEAISSSPVVAATVSSTQSSCALPAVEASALKKHLSAAKPSTLDISLPNISSSVKSTPSSDNKQTRLEMSVSSTVESNPVSPSIPQVKVDSETSVSKKQDSMSEATRCKETVPEAGVSGSSVSTTSNEMSASELCAVNNLATDISKTTDSSASAKPPSTTSAVPIAKPTSTNISPSLSAEGPSTSLKSALSSSLAPSVKPAQSISHTPNKPNTPAIKLVPPVSYDTNKPISSVKPTTSFAPSRPATPSIKPIPSSSFYPDRPGTPSLKLTHPDRPGTPSLKLTHPSRPGTPSIRSALPTSLAPNRPGTPIVKQGLQTSLTYNRPGTPSGKPGPSAPVAPNRPGTPSVKPTPSMSVAPSRPGIPLAKPPPPKMTGVSVPPNRPGTPYVHTNPMKSLNPVPSPKDNAQIPNGLTLNKTEQEVSRTSTKDDKVPPQNQQIIKNNQQILRKNDEIMRNTTTVKRPMQPLMRKPPEGLRSVDDKQVGAKKRRITITAPIKRPMPAPNKHEEIPAKNPRPSVPDQNVNPSAVKKEVSNTKLSAVSTTSVLRNEVTAPKPQTASVSKSDGMSPKLQPASVSKNDFLSPKPQTASMSRSDVMIPKPSSTLPASVMRNEVISPKTPTVTALKNESVTTKSPDATNNSLLRNDITSKVNHATSSPLLRNELSPKTTTAQAQYSVKKEAMTPKHPGMPSPPAFRTEKSPKYHTVTSTFKNETVSSKTHNVLKNDVISPKTPTVSNEVVSPKPAGVLNDVKKEPEAAHSNGRLGSTPSDGSGALDLSASPRRPQTSQPNIMSIAQTLARRHQPPPALSPLSSLSPFPMPVRSPPPQLRIPVPTTQRPSSLSSSSPSPPLMPQHALMMRQQLELQQRLWKQQGMDWFGDVKRFENFMKTLQQQQGHPYYPFNNNNTSNATQRK